MNPSTEHLVSAQTVRKVAALARLHISDHQAEAYASDLGRVLAHFQRLSSLDLTGVEPLASPMDMPARLDTDRPGPTLPNETLMAGAPDAMPPYLRVPKVLGEGGGA